MTNRVYGYARISTKKQSIERQLTNIKNENENAVIITETFTGTTTDRPAWKKLLKAVKSGDTIIFDEVSRMSRNAAEGFETYTDLFNKGVNLVFIKEPHINTDVYRKAIDAKIEGVGNEVADTLIEAVNKVLQIVQRQQIEAAFERSEKEVALLSQRTREGVRRAHERYKRETLMGLPHEKDDVGRKKGTKFETKKAQEQKAAILKHSIDFNGNLNDRECIKLTGLSRNTFYKYKRELRQAV